MSYTFKNFITNQSVLISFVDKHYYIFGMRGQQLKSAPGSRAKAYATFRNHSPRVVDLLWLNWEGERVNYTKNGLKQGHKMDMNTFEGHPWIFRDHQSGDKLVFTAGTDMQSLEVFFPAVLVSLLLA